MSRCRGPGARGPEGKTEGWEGKAKKGEGNVKAKGEGKCGEEEAASHKAGTRPGGQV